MNTAMTPRYAFAEEVLSSAIHGIGIVLSIVALTVLVAYAAMHGDAWHVTSVAVFGTTLILLYTASTLYHGIPNEVAKPTLRTLDHIAIYLLIAGTYTPYTLVSLRGPWGWSLFAVVWGLALVGIALELTSLKRLRAPAVALYIGMGWSALAAAGPLIQAVPSGGLWLLFLGGAAYTLGVPFYLWRSLPFSHAIWHGFVLLGSVLHFFSILWYVVPAAPV
ncbi:PAQR family membrane homeostasis protein TrhA [Tahibacter soli]|jgi:hemolysin III|uniref:Hemolysin III family protein n=1 Tax=Tahibacter soli TaxID=2983605 RepID=A0A9X3YNC0_9GAMM|nr:hemolysin III family protein [Tahibacter soli]MDC8013913.1 hemolysin III family protein [Tahibacter soli]